MCQVLLKRFAKFGEIAGELAGDAIVALATILEGIARAIVGRPKILLWDEPTTGLDPVNTAAVERLISRLSEELEVTSLVVTHDIEGGLDMCDRVSMLEGGKLRFCGTPDEFRNSDDHVVQAFVDRAAAERALDMAEKE